MSLKTSIAAAAICCTLHSAWAQVPKILIVPLLKPKGDVPLGTDTLANTMAQDLDRGGVVSAVVWDWSDPNFRSAVLSGKLKDPPERPNINDATQAARDLGATYLMVFVPAWNSGYLDVTGSLYAGGSRLWKNRQRIAVHLRAGDTDSDQAAESIARTWTELMETGPMKRLPIRPKFVTPSPQTISPSQQAEVPTKAARSNKSLDETIQKLQQSGDVQGVYLLLDDAVDRNPLDESLRWRFVRFLESEGKWAAAARQAELAGSIVPDGANLREDSIQDWIRAGRPEEAAKEANDALATSRGSHHFLDWQAAALLAAGKPNEAVLVDESAAKHGDTSELLAIRATAQAILGGPGPDAADISRLSKISFPATDSLIFRLLAMSIASATSKDSDAIQSLADQVAEQQPESSAADALRPLAAGLNSRSTLLTALKPPPDLGEVFELIELAQNLQQICVSDLRSALKSRSQDSLTDARINLQDAIDRTKKAFDLLSRPLAGQE